MIRRDDDLRKPAIRSTNSNIQNQIEFFIKWSIAGSGLGVNPGVWQQGVVLALLGKFPNFIKRLILIESDKKDLMDSTINIKINIVGRPLHAIGVIAASVIATANLFGVGGFPKRIRDGCWTYYLLC